MTLISTESIAPALQRDLRNAVVGLDRVNPLAGLVRFVVLGGLCLSFVILAGSTSQTGWFVIDAAIAGLFYAFWLVCTHDATHQTLTGWRWFDDWMPRLIAYPMLWPHGTYAQLHRLHHGWNGIDLRDPERVQWTAAEYRQANLLTRWYIRHQWTIDLLVLGGTGLIAKTVTKGFRLQSHLPALRRALVLDAIGIFLIQSCIWSVAVSNHRLGDYLLFWFILERMIGIVLQMRDHLEHYGLWSNGPWSNGPWSSKHSHQLTQFYACRNLEVSPIVAWLVGGLNNHSAHHAFPNVPFNRLPEARRRIERILQQHQLPELAIGESYIGEALRLSQTPLLISEKGNDTAC